MKKSKVRRGVWFAAAFLWMIFIWSNSLQTADESSQVSLGVLAWFVPLLESIGLPEELWHTLIRKLAHMTEFAVAGILWSAALSPESEITSRVRWRRRGIALLVCLTAAVIDETIQRFVPGRSCELRDVGIDLLGIVVGILVEKLCAIMLKKATARRKNKS